MRNYKKYLTSDNLTIFLLSLYPITLALGSFVSELLNLFIILTFILLVSKIDITKIVNNKIFIYCIIIWLFLIINLFFFLIIFIYHYPEQSFLVDSFFFLFQLFIY